MIVGPAEAIEAAVAARERAAYDTLGETAAVRQALRALAPIYQAAGRRPSATEVLRGSDAINRRLREVEALAQRSLCSAHPTLHSPERHEASLASDRALAARGLVQNCLHTHAALRNPTSLAYLRAQVEIGNAVRTTPVIPIRMLILDSDWAFVPVEGDAVAGLVTDPVVVAVIRDIFDYLWERGTPVSLDDTARPVPRDIEAALMRELAAGRSDDAIARRLGMSTRSLSRHLATLFETYGVSSRFQFGVAASAAGLVGEGPDQS